MWVRGSAGNGDLERWASNCARHGGGLGRVNSPCSTTLRVGPSAVLATTTQRRSSAALLVCAHSTARALPAHAIPHPTAPPRMMSQGLVLRDPPSVRGRVHADRAGGDDGRGRGAVMVARDQASLFRRSRLDVRGGIRQVSLAVGAALVQARCAQQLVLGLFAFASHMSGLRMRRAAIPLSFYEVLQQVLMPLLCHSTATCCQRYGSGPTPPASSCVARATAAASASAPACVRASAYTRTMSSVPDGLTNARACVRSRQEGGAGEHGMPLGPQTAWAVRVG